MKRYIYSSNFKIDRNYYFELNEYESICDEIAYALSAELIKIIDNRIKENDDIKASIHKLTQDLGVVVHFYFRSNTIFDAEVIYDSNRSNTVTFQLYSENYSTLVEYTKQISDSDNLTKGEVQSFINSCKTSIQRSYDSIVSEIDNRCQDISAYYEMMNNRIMNSNNKISNWRSLKSKLIHESEENIDSLDEQTSAGLYLEKVCKKLENTLGVELEPSIQGGIGGIWFYSADGDVIAEDYDYNTFNEEVVDLAIQSKTSKEFTAKYKKYLQSIFNDPKYAVDDI